MAFIDVLEPARNPQGVDVGSCLYYYRLSYRRRFLRDGWVALGFLLILSYSLAKGMWGLWHWFMLFALPVSMSFNYYSWSEIER